MQFTINIATMHFQKNVHINHIKMLYHHRIHFLEGIDVNKTSASKERITCQD